MHPGGMLLLASATAFPVALLEELGWTGFATPRLRRRYGILAIGLFVGTLWGVWHLPLFRESNSFSATLPLMVLLVKLLCWTPPYRVLMVWVHDRTESLPVVILMHASLVVTQTTMFPARGSLTSPIAWAAGLWILVAAVATRRGRRNMLDERSEGVRPGQRSSV